MPNKSHFSSNPRRRVFSSPGVTGRRRPFARRVTTCLFLFCIGSPFASLFWNTTYTSFESTSTFLEIQQSKCPPYWTHGRCRKRQEEFWSSVNTNEQIRREMQESARQRAQRDEYQVIEPKHLQYEHDDYFRRVREAVGGNTTNNTSTDPFMPWANFSRNAFPDINILGFPKAGTSQLFKLLVSHPDAEPVFKRKEFCMDHGHFLDYTAPQNFGKPAALRALRKNLFGYHKYMLKKRSENPSESSKLVNACLQPREVEYHHFYTPIPESSKFIVIFRDPADWLWASWNFWVDKNLDNRPPVDHDWATFGLQYRSPELFHELILSQEAIKSAGKRFRTMREQTVKVPRRLVHLLGSENILFLKSENMKASNGQLNHFLSRLGDFTGLPAAKFNDTVARGRTNCNAKKGFGNECDSGNSTSSTGYPITHFRPLLEETRKLIYIQFFEECKVWQREFGIVYQDCLDILSR